MANSKPLRLAIPTDINRLSGDYSSPSGLFLQKHVEFLSEQRRNHVRIYIAKGALLVVDKEDNEICTIHLKRLPNQTRASVGIIEKPVPKIRCENNCNAIYERQAWIVAGTTEIKINEFLRSLANPVEALSLKHLLIYDFKSRQTQGLPQDLALVKIALDLNSFLKQNYVGNFESEEILRDFEEFIEAEQMSSQSFRKVLAEHVPDIYENSISKKFEKLFPGGFCLRSGETAIIQAFASTRDHLSYVSIRLMVAAAVEKCFKLTDGEGELKQQNNYFQERIRRVARIIGIDKNDQDSITHQVQNLDAEMARISREVSSKLEDRENQQIRNLKEFDEDMEDITDIIPPPPPDNNNESGFFQDIPDADEEDGGDSGDDDDDNPPSPPKDGDGCPLIYSTKRRLSFELEGSPQQQDLLVVSSSSSVASPTPSEPWISLSPSPQPSKSSEFLTPPSPTWSTPISSPPSWHKGRNECGTPNTPEGYRSPGHPSPSPPCPPPSPSNPSNPSLDSDSNTIQISSGSSSPKVLFEGVPDIPTFPNPKPKLPEKELDDSDDSLDSVKIMKLIFKDKKNLNPTVKNVSITQEVVEDPLDKIRRKLRKIISATSSSVAASTPPKPKENKTQNTIQKVFITNNNGNLEPPPLAPPLATYLIGTDLDSPARFEGQEDPLAISVTEELVDLSNEYGNNLFRNSNRSRPPKRLSSIGINYMESPAEKPVSPKPSTSTSASASGSGVPPAPMITKKQKKSQDLDPDFDPRSMVKGKGKGKGKSSRNAPSKLSKNRKDKNLPPSPPPPKTN